jgi:hypothetical protein
MEKRFANALKCKGLTYYTMCDNPSITTQIPTKGRTFHEKRSTVKTSKHNKTPQIPYKLVPERHRGGGGNSLLLLGIMGAKTSRLHERSRSHESATTVICFQQHSQPPPTEMPRSVIGSHKRDSIRCNMFIVIDSGLPSSGPMRRDGRSSYGSSIKISIFPLALILPPPW